MKELKFMQIEKSNTEHYEMAKNCGYLLAKNWMRMKG